MIFTKSFAVRSLYLPLLVLMAAFIVGNALAVRSQQTLSSSDRDRGRQMLRAVKDDIKKNYYDPAFHGVDLDTHFATADEKLKQATSLGQMFGIIAQALIDFDDSHLYFVPPGRANRYDYGWRMAMIGDKCFVTSVKPGSDAATKGLQAGDEIRSIDGYQPTRDNHWKMLYSYYVLRPKPGVRLVVIKPDGSEQQLDVMTHVTQRKREIDLTGLTGTSSSDINELWREDEDADRQRRRDSRQVNLSDDVLVWKLPAFAYTDNEVDNAMQNVRKYKALILDLRGNGGGAETTLLRIVGNLFDRDVKLGDIHQRKETKPLVAKTRGGDNVFKGSLVVLIDSQSASAAELLARIVQLEQRGIVIGDRSAGAVMRSKVYSHQSGLDTVVFYGTSVTDADVVMTDGKSLEHTGVVPDRLKLPADADLAKGRDPVLAFAASLAGVTLDPEKAGALLPPRWEP